MQKWMRKKDERTIFLLWLRWRHWSSDWLRLDNVQIMKPVRLKNTSSCNSLGLPCLSNCSRINAWTKVTENFSLAFQNWALKYFAKAETEKLMRKKDVPNIRCTNKFNSLKVTIKSKCTVLLILFIYFLVEYCSIYYECNNFSINSISPVLHFF